MQCTISSLCETLRANVTKRLNNPLLTTITNKSFVPITKQRVSETSLGISHGWERWNTLLSMSIPKTLARVAEDGSAVQVLGCRLDMITSKGKHGNNGSIVNTCTTGVYPLAPVAPFIIITMDPGSTDTLIFVSSRISSAPPSFSVTPQRPCSRVSNARHSKSRHL